ncbi:MAG: dihydroneopterin aldolase [Caulobacteraceae bacterium]|nr:dihydroneopterin aldolase [Caulobacteraceae bacterium]
MALRSTTVVFVRGLTLQAQVGIHPHERDRTQPLRLDVELTLVGEVEAKLANIFNYEVVRREARALTEAGHFDLVETFARQLGEALMADPKVERARIRVEKPQALAPDAEAAGVELLLERA